MRQSLLKIAGGYVAGTLLAWAICLLLFALAGLMISRGRIRETVNYAFDTKFFHDPGYSTADSEDCALLEMAYLRRSAFLANIFDNRWMPPGAGGDICHDTRLLVNSGVEHAPGAYDSYVPYPQGSRAVTSILISVMSVRHAKVVLWLGVYGSVALIALAAWFKARPLFPAFLTICLLLAFAYQWHLYAGNLHLSEVFSVGFFLLAGFVWFQKPLASWPNRVFFFAVLGGLTAFFDSLHGGEQTMLSLGIVFNQFLYGQPRVQSAVKEAVALVVIMGSAYFFLTAARLAALTLFSPWSGKVWELYWHELSFRQGTEVPGVGKVGIVDVAHNLWTFRTEITGTETGGILLVLGFIAWVAVTLYVLWRRFKVGEPLLAQLAALAMAGAGIFLFFGIFKNVTYIHPWLLGRMMMLPVGYGFVAVWLLTREHRESPPP